jgi:hypothetical protein
MTTYQIRRFYQRDRYPETIKTGLTLEQAQEHCEDPETSSTTAKSTMAVEHTEKYGDWFDGYDEE